MPADEPKGALCRLDAELLYRSAALVDEFVDEDRRIRTDRQLGAVDEFELPNPRGIRAQRVLEIHRRRRTEHARTRRARRTHRA